MDSQINIRPYGDVGFGPSSIALADEKKAIAGFLRESQTFYVGFFDPWGKWRYAGWSAPR